MNKKTLLGFLCGLIFMVCACSPYKYVLSNQFDSFYQQEQVDSICNVERIPSNLDKWKSYVLCLILLVFVSVVPLIPAKVLGMAIDSFSTGTLTKNTLIIYVLLLFVCPILTYVFNIFYHFVIIIFTSF